MRFWTSTSSILILFLPLPNKSSIDSNSIFRYSKLKESSVFDLEEGFIKWEAIIVSKPKPDTLMPLFFKTEILYLILWLFFKIFVLSKTTFNSFNMYNKSLSEKIFLSL